VIYLCVSASELDAVTHSHSYIGLQPDSCSSISNLLLLTLVPRSLRVRLPCTIQSSFSTWTYCL